jgi:hypothetical protein
MPALVARGFVPQPQTIHKTAPSTWTCSNDAAPRATSAVISPLLAQHFLTRLYLTTLGSTFDPFLVRTALHLRWQSAVGRVPDDGAGVHVMDCRAGLLPEICQKLRYT